MNKRTGTQNERRDRHIQRGGRAFLPLSRMRQIRWEEAVLNAQSRRKDEEKPTILHFNCGCGLIEHQGIPLDAKTFRSPKKS